MRTGRTPAACSSLAQTLCAFTLTAWNLAVTSEAPASNTTSAAPAAPIARLIALLKSSKFDLSNEKATQKTIAEAIAAAGIACVREFRTPDGHGVLDMLVDNGICLEVKMCGSRKIAVFKQLARYARSDSVNAVVLVSNLAMALPPMIGGKPAYFVSLGRAWL